VGLVRPRRSHHNHPRAKSWAAHDWLGTVKLSYIGIWRRPIVPTETVLLFTKLFLPAPRPTLFPLPRLTARLENM
jgi:hypothetical protein